MNKLISLLRPALESGATTGRPPLPLEMMVPLAVHRLANHGAYRLFKLIWGASKSTMCNFVNRFCKGMSSFQMNIAIGVD